MIVSADTNLFLHAANPDSSHHSHARRFFAQHANGTEWQWAGTTNSGFRQIIDARLAFTLLHHGVTHFATANERHFGEFGFQKVWNPLVPDLS